MKVLVFAAVLVAVTAVDLVFRDCGSSGTILKATSADCGEAVCKLKKGHSYKIDITYKPKDDISAMDAKLYGVIAGIPVPFPLPVSDGCAACGNVCPVTAGTEVTFSEVLKVEPAYPALKLTSRWKLLAKSGDAIICADIPVVIVS